MPFSQLRFIATKLCPVLAPETLRQERTAGDFSVVSAEDHRRCEQGFSVTLRPKLHGDRDNAAAAKQKPKGNPWPKGIGRLHHLNGIDALADSRQATDKRLIRRAQRDQAAKATSLRA